jgi:hypothetical protein
MKLTVALLISLFTLPARAHDFWIEPSSFAPREGETVALRLKVGHFDAGEGVPRDTSRIERFVAVSAQGATPIAGIDGRDPAGYIRWSAERPGVIAYESLPRATRLSPAAFKRYVKEERLRNAGRQRGELLDRFSRSARLIFPDGGQSWQRPAGLPLEILPQNDPWAESEVRFLVTFNGTPLSKASVIAVDRRNPHAERHAVTDAQGRVTLTLPGSGPWLVKCVRAERVKPNEFRSWWGSLVFAR